METQRLDFRMRSHSRGGGRDAVGGRRLVFGGVTSSSGKTGSQEEIFRRPRRKGHSLVKRERPEM